VWLELNFGNDVVLEGEKIERIVNELRSLLIEGQVALEAEAIHFSVGQDLLDWVREVKTEIKPEEVKQ